MKKPLLKDLTLEQKIGQLLLGYQWDICRKSEIDHNIFRTWEERRSSKKELEDRGANVTITRRLKNNEELAEISAKSDLIIYATYIGNHEPMGPPSLFGEELRTYLHAFTSGKEKTVGISLYASLYYAGSRCIYKYIQPQCRNDESCC